ncbi:MAG: hypothetical protein JWM47_1497 [Acidimicrobiales bacterium]|nr:hypothetical protein [Acidimicrobiales bacterium]
MPTRRTRPTGSNGLAIASLILSLVWIVGVGSLLAVILGIVALVQIQKTGQRGTGMATSGIVFGILGLLVAPFALIFLRAGIVDSGNPSSAACKTDKRTTLTAMEAWYASSPDVGYPSTERQLVEDGFLREESALYDFAPGAGGGLTRPTLVPQNALCR